MIEERGVWRPEGGQKKLSLDGEIKSTQILTA